MLRSAQGMANRQSGLDINLKSFSPKEFREGQEATKNFEVTFKNIVYGFAPSLFHQISAKVLGREVDDIKVILRGISGQFKCGELTAIMGPSGSGKSILLECLIGKRFEGLLGEVRIKDYSRIKIAYISQTDKVYGGLTVREAIVFSSKLQNTHITSTRKRHVPTNTDDDVSGVVVDKDEEDANVPNGHIEEDLEDLEQADDGGGSTFHDRMATKIMHQLGLTVCADTRISSCSGGQQKRASIAMELVSKPSILVLDEPTSGLDSAACQSVIELLRSIAEGTPKVAVVLTIHQPSWHVFKLFHKVFMLAKGSGTCIYEGPPTEVVPALAHFGCECPANYNPADYLIEVACGFEGKAVVKELSKFQDRAFFERIAEEDVDVPSERLADVLREPDFPFVTHVWLLLIRALILMFRDIWLVTIRIAIHVGCAIGLVLVFRSSGLADGCPPNVPKNLNSVEVFYDFERAYQEDMITSYANMSFLFFSPMFLMFTSMMPTILLFATEVNIVVKEVQNKWYSPTTYYLATIFAELPFLIGMSFVFSVITYYGTEAPDPAWRFAAYTGLSMLNALVAHGQGSLISVIFVDQPAAGVYITPVSTVPMMLLSGFFIQLADMSNPIIVLSYASYARFVLENLLLVTYGYDRCGENISHKLSLAQKALHGWIVTTMGLSQSNRLRPELGHLVSANTTNFGVSFDPVSVADKLSSGIVEQMLSDYVGADGKVRSRNLNSFNIDEDDMGPNVAIVLSIFLFYRVLTYFLLYRRIMLKR